jgi:putative ABC transport system permease protein
MLQNYILTAFRNFTRYKVYAMINIFGLTIALATSIFIFLWVKTQLSYDTFHQGSDRIYHVMNNWAFSDGTISTGTNSSDPLLHAIRDELPEIESVTRRSWDEKQLLQVGETSFEESGFYADTSFFHLFTFPIIQGNNKNPLSDKNSIAISRNLAEKFFPNENPIGKVIKVNEGDAFQVTAVFENAPKYSSLQFEFVMNYEVFKTGKEWLDNWGNTSVMTYVKLRPNSSLELVNAKMKEIAKSHCPDCKITFFLYLFSDLHLKSKFENGIAVGGDILYVKLFTFVAIFILIIAAINFTNLATARATMRSKEIGIRKAIGAHRGALIGQFLGESLLTAWISLVLAIMVVLLSLPYIKDILGQNLELNLNNPLVFSSLFAISTFTGLIAGSYPALFLSSFKPATVLKGSNKGTLKGGGLRKALVVFQFALSFVLIVASFVIYDQVNYIRNTNLGFQKENIVVFQVKGSLWIEDKERLLNGQESFKHELLANPTIKNVAFSGHLPFDIQNTTTDPVWPDKPKDSVVPFGVLMCDKDFIPTIGMEVVEGRNFSDNYQMDSANYLVNETAARAMGLADPVGTELDMWNGKGKIIGVVKDFHNQHFKNAIKPLVFVYMPENAWMVYVKIDGKYPQEALKAMEAGFKKYAPNYSFDFQFLDEGFDQLYRHEITIGNISLWFTIVAIIISCLGLLGLATFSAERRTKEIGIRKVLGASITSILFMLSQEYFKLILAAFVVAVPIANYFITEWLRGFAYKINVEWWLFAIPGFVVIILALLAVSGQSLKAASTNPVKSLRSE